MSRMGQCYVVGDTFTLHPDYMLAELLQLHRQIPPVKE
jgi:hypothetical protein